MFVYIRGGDLHMEKYPYRCLKCVKRDEGEGTMQNRHEKWFENWNCRGDFVMVMVIFSVISRIINARDRKIDNYKNKWYIGRMEWNSKRIRIWNGAEEKDEINRSKIRALLIVQRIFQSIESQGCAKLTNRVIKITKSYVTYFHNPLPSDSSRNC